MAPISQSEDYLGRLKYLIDGAETLETQSFIVRPLTTDELLLKRRCSGCNKALSQILRKNSKLAKAASRPEYVEKPPPVDAQRHCSATDTSPSLETKDKSLVVLVQEKRILCCAYHEGTLIGKRWSCCGQSPAARPCSGAYEHVPRAQDLLELSKLYQVHPTPVMPPNRDSIRVAVALDCEMGTAASGDSELIRVTLVDYFSEEILIDNLVQPDVPMQHLNTRYSGVSWPDLKKARRNGTCLSGKAGARQAVWQYVGTDTIVVGHGVSNDLRALRWIHTLVVDSLIKESNRSKIEEGVMGTNQAAKIVVQDNLQGKGIVGVPAEFLSPTMQGQADATSTMVSEKDVQNEVPIRKPSSHSLKALAKKYLNKDIQMSGRRGHDSLEDAVAARDIVHWNVLHLNRDKQA